MKCIRWSASSFFALVISFVLAPAHAAGPTKQFSLNMSPLSILAAPIAPNNYVKVTARFENETPSGNSTFNSLRLKLDPPTTWLAIVVDSQHPVQLLYATSDGGTPQPASGNATVVSGTELVVQNLNPIKPKWHLLVTFYVQVLEECTGKSATWSAEVFTGSSLSGDTFQFLSAPFSSTTTSGCDTTLACAPSSYDTEPVTDGNKTTITREADKDPNAPCSPVAISVVITQTGREVHIQWDEATYPNLVLKTETTWPLEAVPADNPSTPANEAYPARTKVAWCPPSNFACSPVFIEVQLCTKSDSPTTADGLATMPILPTGVPSPYVAGQHARACLLTEVFYVKSAQECSAASLTAPCALVESMMYVIGDPWLSRN